VTCGENSLGIDYSFTSTSSDGPAILNSLTARNAGLRVKLLTDAVRGHQNIANKGLRIAFDETFPSFKLSCNI